MKVLLVHNFYGTTAPSGENKVFDAEKSMLIANGHEVSEFTRHSDEIRFSGMTGIIRGALATPWNPAMSRALSKKIEKEQPDIVHVHNTFPLVSPSIFHIINRTTPCVLTLHNYRIFCPAAILNRQGKTCTECLDQRSAWPSIKHGCYRSSRIATLPLAISVGIHRKLGTWTKHINAFITLSEFQREILVNSGLSKRKVHVKPNFYSGNHQVVPWHERGDYVVYAGRLTAEKGVESLIKAWKLWGDDAPELRIIGESENRKQMESLASGARIRFLGQIDASDAHAEIANARLLILPSEWYETFGLVVTEAFAFGTPVAVSDIGPLPDLVQRGRCGIIFRPADPESLCEEVRGVWKTPGALEILGQRSRREFDNKYTERENYRLQMSIYQTAIAQKG